MLHRGVILQATYRIHGGVPVVHLYGRLDDGRSFLVRDSRQRPCFYVREQDAPRVRAELEQEPRSSRMRSMAGEPLCRIELNLPSDAPPARERLHSVGVETFEADVRFAMRYLMERGIKGACIIHGEPVRGAERVDAVFGDPEIEADNQADVVPLSPRVLSFDIETDGRAESLLAISLYGLGADEVLIVDPEQRPMPEGARAFSAEADVLEAFCARVAELDPDVLTGWNVVDFDLAVLSRVAARVRRPLELGRDSGEVRIRRAEGYFGSGSASIPGRLVLDGMDLLRGAFVRVEDYSLDAVARTVLGEGKALAGHVDDRVGEILANYRDDLPAFARYARTDARLPLEILTRLDLVTLAFARSRLTGMMPDRVAASIASFDYLYLTELNRRGFAAPSVRSGDSRVHAAQAGGHVLEPRVGLHDQVWVFDFRSLYPSIIRTFNIDPLGFVAEPGDEDLIVLENGVGFRRAPAILPGMLDELFPRREEARRAGDEVASQAIKILMNSFYGVLGTPACRFHNAAIANAITGQGRHLLLWSRSWFEERGLTVLYGDTDSLFVASGEQDGEQAMARGEELCRQINADLDAYVTGRWRVKSALTLEFEKLYGRLILPAVRSGGGGGGARKRYAGLRHGAAPDEVEFVGMEVVRRDWTELAKRVQRELYQRLFAGEPVEGYLVEVVNALRGGELDDLLVYRKGLRKSIDAYTASTPPHVAAARKSRSPPGRVIAYVMTTAGPEPLDARTADLDREHYLARQIRPVAEPVLSSLGLEFERVIGDDRQLGLF